MAGEKRSNHWCVLCGAGYHACDSCGRERNFTPWRSLADTMEHYKIFMVLKDYNNKIIEKEDARELLSGLNLSDREHYKDNARKLLSDIFSET